MNQKFTFKSIKAGQTQKINVVSGGAGISGNALVLNAVEGSRYQLADLVTLVSPKKLQLKRQGADLHLALPGGDLDAPDVVIKGYFDAKGVSLWGTSIDGEALAYNTSGLVASASTPAAPMGASIDAADAVPEQRALAGAASATQTVTLGESSLGGTFSNPWVLAGGVGLAAVGLGVVVVVMKGTLHEPIMRERLKAATLKLVMTPMAREQEVLSGRADVFMTDYPYSRRMLETTDWARLIAPPVTYHETPYAYAMAPGDDLWAQRLERFVSDIRADGRLLRAAERYKLQAMVVKR